jgi:hypothetical protein
LVALAAAGYLTIRTDSINAADFSVSILIEIGAAILTLAVLVVLEQRILEETERRTRELIEAQSNPLPRPARHGLASVFQSVAPEPIDDPQLYDFLMRALVTETMSPLDQFLTELDEAAAAVRFSTSGWAGAPPIPGSRRRRRLGRRAPLVKGPGRRSDTPAWTVGIRAAIQTRQRVRLTAYHGLAESGRQVPGYNWSEDVWVSSLDVPKADHAKLGAAMSALTDEMAGHCQHYFERLVALHAAAPPDP